MTAPFDIVILGLTVTSSWGNGHATTWRALIRGLALRGYRILFLERDAPWYAENRDEPHPDGATTVIYESVEELIARFECVVSHAALVIVGSYVPDGIRIGEWATSVALGKCVFYDIDTPVTLARLEAGNAEYINPELIRRYHAYLSFTGGPTLRNIERRYGSPMARALYCSVDPEKYNPPRTPTYWDLGYLGTYSADRQPSLDALFIAPARQWSKGRFAIAGPQYPETISWPTNVERTIHLSPREHASFYGAQRFTLNITREAMKKAGYSPSVRLFEAGACGVPVISDCWEGLDRVFRIGEELLVAESADDVLRYLRDFPESARLRVAAGARRRVLAEHTPVARALQLEHYLKEMNEHVSPGATWRDGCSGNIARGLETRLPSERDGKRAGAAACAVSLPGADRSNLHEPTRTCR
ncbi:MAG: glycosyltransferase [Acidobacteriaceae bacterium]|nr:glycosyltransferase [Acidobacteriaceae bacterium]